MTDSDRLVDSIVGATSDRYREAGFKDFRFGMSESEVREVAERSTVPVREGRQYFFMEEGRLIGYGRRYDQDNAEYLAKLRELLGGALPENLTEADGIRQGATVDRLGDSVATAARRSSFLARYYFADSIAYVQAGWGASAQANVNSVSRQEYVLLNIFDRRWIEARLLEHVADCREVLKVVEGILADEASGTLRMSNMPTYPGAVVSYKVPDADAKFETVKLLGARNESFIVVDRALADFYERPRHTVSIGVHLLANPEGVTPLAKYSFSGD